MKPENEIYTRREIAHYVTLFFYNWTEEDFLEVYKNSHLGNDYFWKKLQSKIKNEEINPTQAMVEVFLNMDNKHQNLLVDYVLDIKYKKSIESQREWEKIIEDKSKWQEV